VGLGYLTLDRPAPSLSGGEGQRIRLASQIGSELTGVIYVLDEPSIGLHQRDNKKLLATLKHLRDIGNTVVVVEHDREAMEEADWLIDFGPGAGRDGGEIVAAGDPARVKRSRRSVTGRYLRGDLEIPVPQKRRQPDGRRIRVEGARENNLKDISVEFPLGLLICVTGVSGAGKSTLVNHILYPAVARALHGSDVSVGSHSAIHGLPEIDKVIDIDQSPIGRTPRSNPATYTKLFDHIRHFFALLPEARMHGYKPGRFSFNVRGGRCETCEGDGVKRVEMHFLPDVYVPCEVCHGKRFNEATLQVKYNTLSIADVLALTVDEALLLFKNHPPIKRALETLTDVGLGYIALGQSSPTLSGGEAQRVKLSRELAKRSTGRTLYILDEPTTGLHFDDIKKLLGVLDRLADNGNTVIVIEHNLDVIKTADHVIDLGPEGGEAGGEVVATGTPEEVAAAAGSYTGRFLGQVLGRSTGARARPRKRSAQPRTRSARSTAGNP
jgi:excinuclease ABC subunit A